ncbi:hypothetical protein THAOC_15413, partial [Thalassiosira oceanica]
ALLLASRFLPALANRKTNRACALEEATRRAHSSRGGRPGRPRPRLHRKLHMATEKSLWCYYVSGYYLTPTMQYTPKVVQFTTF